MSDLRKAAQMALDAIDVYGPDYMHGLPKKKYVDALRKALAQPDSEMPKNLFGPNLEQVLNAAGFYKRKPETEPVAVAWIEHGLSPWKESGEVRDVLVWSCGTIGHYTPLYTAPPQRKPLTKDEMWKLMDDEALWQFARAIERAHGIE